MTSVVQRVQRRTVPFNSTAESRANVNACGRRRYALILDRRHRHVKQDFARIAVYGLYITILTRERGKIAERRETALLQLEARFGPLAAAIRQRVEALSPEELRQLTLDFVKAQSLKELRLED